MSGGMGFDTSIYRLPEQPSALNQLAQIAGINNAVTANQLQQQQIERFAGEKSAGGNFLEAIDPNTGLVNPNKLGGLLRANPSAAIVAPQMLQQQQGLQGGQIANETGQTELAIKRRNQVAQGMAGLVSKPDLTAQDAVNYVQQLTRAGVLSSEQAQQHMQEIQGIGNNKRALSNYIFGHYSAMMGINAATPEQIGVTAEGAPVTGLRGGAVRQITSPQATKPEGAKGATAPGGIVTSLAPGQAGAQAIDLEGAARRGQALNEQADKVPERKATLETMASLLNDFNSGKGAKAEAAIRSALGRFGLDPNTKLTAGTEEFAKLANQIAAQQAGSLGTTDQQQKTVMGANPSTEFSKLGNEKVIAVLKGNEDAIAAKRDAFQRFKAQPGNAQASYDQFSAQFNKDFDPRVFQYLNMSPSMRADFRKGLTVTQSEVFQRNAQKALDNGWIGNGP